MSRILLMQDDALRAQEFKAALEQNGHEASITHGALAAIEMCKTTKFDLVIADMFISKDNKLVPDGGILLIGRLRMKDQLTLFAHDAPIIAMAGRRPNRAEPKVIRLALQVGATVCLENPVSFDELCNWVDKLLVKAEPSDCVVTYYPATTPVLQHHIGEPQQLSDVGVWDHPEDLALRNRG